MATTPDIEIHKGEDTVIQVTIVDQAGNLKNVTGASISFRLGDIRKPLFIFQKAGVIDNGVGGLISVDILNTESADWDVRVYDYQFIVTDSGNDVQVVKEGKMNVKFMLPVS